MNVLDLRCPNCPNHCAYPGLCTLGMSFFDRMKGIENKETTTGDNKNTKDDK